ncbi:MAG: hypothetical protein RBG1_1C00001G0824 [candidate division Zixibacteria bacterium RBG-1]|nr:MAG: hypothetical protein RBG1_1C00001G0824 [candidate division Zixibacteria bacterium RBG-1]OGC83527.1 MAG: hypothetical protein A2V73_05890 [candidate division Zixibacteria bacterium RBG_19FT_COMBO_42_43]
MNKKNISFRVLGLKDGWGLVFPAILICGLTWTASAKDSGSKNQKENNLSRRQPIEFISVQFFNEPQKPLLADWQPVSPSFEGKAFVKDKHGKYIQVQRTTPMVRSEANFFPGISQAPQADFYIQDGSETSIAINYDNGNNLIATYNEGWNFNPDIPHSNSTDGNVSWTNRSFPNGAGTFTDYPFDPWANAGNDSSEFYSTQIRNDGASASSHCVVSRSPDGGESFTLFFEEIKAVFQDREMVDIDRTTARGGGSGTSHDKKVYLCYDDWGGGATYTASVLQVVDSLGSGLAEYQISTVALFKGSQMQPVADTGDGRLYIQATAIGGGGGTIFARFHSVVNAGAGVTTDVSVLSWSAVGQRLGVSSRWGLNGHRIDQHGYLDIDRSSGPRRGRLYFISNRNPNPTNSALDQGDVYLSVSTNGGVNWSSALLVTVTGKTQYFPMLNVDEQGWLHIAYYQNDSGSANGGVLNASKANLYYAFSTDGGTIWSLPRRVNADSTSLDFNDPPPDLSGSNYYLIGDYAQLQATGIDTSTKVYVLWSGYDKDRSDGSVGNKKERVYCTTLTTLSGCLAKAGDVTGEGSITLPDVVALINFVFRNGPAPSPACRGNVDGNAVINLADIVYLINRIFRSGSAPINSSVCCL